MKGTAIPMAGGRELTKEFHQPGVSKLESNGVQKTPRFDAFLLSLIMNLHSFWKRFPVERFSTGWIADGIGSGKNCIECGECEEKCPYLLPIREMIVENLEFYERVVS